LLHNVVNRLIVRFVTASKQDRQQAIRQIVASRVVASQEELRQLLGEQGWDVTQSTLSRDMRDLRIARVPTAGGIRYTAASGAGPSDEGRATLATILPQFFVRLDGVRELLVVRTKIAGAQPIAEAIDAEEDPDILGTIAGENTILIICRSDAARERTVKRLLALARR
jgi:transcriptional regulator of arginine metabolism